MTTKIHYSYLKYVLSTLIVISRTYAKIKMITQLTVQSTLQIQGKLPTFIKKNNGDRHTMQLNTLSNVDLGQLLCILICLNNYKCIDLVNLTTITQMESNFPKVEGKPTKKAIVMCSHFHSRMGILYMIPLVRSCSYFTCYQFKNLPQTPQCLFHPTPQIMLLKTMIHLGCYQVNRIT